MLSEIEEIEDGKNPCGRVVETSTQYDMIPIISSVQIQTQDMLAHWEN